MKKRILKAGLVGYIIFSLCLCCIVLCCCFYGLIVIQKFSESSEPSTTGSEPSEDNNLIWSTIISDGSQDKIVYIDDSIIIQSATLSNDEEFQNCQNGSHTCLFVLDKESGDLINHFDIKGDISKSLTNIEGDLLVLTSDSDPSIDKSYVHLIDYDNFEDRIVSEVDERYLDTTFNSSDKLDPDEPIIFYNSQRNEIYQFNKDTKQVSSLGILSESISRFKRVGINKYLLLINDPFSYDNDLKYKIISVDGGKINERDLSENEQKEFEKRYTIKDEGIYIEEFDTFEGLKAYDSESQNLVWSIDLTERYEILSPENQAQILSHIFYEDNVILGTNYKEIISVEKDTGIINWSVELPTSSTKFFQVGDNAYFLGFGKGYGLGKINLKTGETFTPVRPEGTSADWYAPDYIMENGSLYVGDNNGVYKFDISE